MLEHRLNVAVIIGSTRTGRFGPVPAKWEWDLAVIIGSLVSLSEGGNFSE